MGIIFFYILFGLFCISTVTLTLVLLYCSLVIRQLKEENGYLKGIVTEISQAVRVRITDEEDSENE